MRIVLAGCIAIGMACADVVHAETYTKEECVDGYAVAVVMDAANNPQAGYQLVVASGKPKLCGERKKQAELKAEAYIEAINLQDELWNKHIERTMSFHRIIK